MLFVWLVIGVLLLAAELHHLALYLLFGALGAFAAAVVALVAPGAYVVQGVVAIASTTSGVLLLRPYLSTVIHRREGRSPTKGVHGGFVGHHVFTVDVVGDADHPGHVKLAGERWLAATDWHHPIEAGSEVIITAVVGTTLHVLPLDPTHGLDRTLEPVDELPRQPSSRPGGEEVPQGASHSAWRSASLPFSPSSPCSH